jgi:hypothetical protein
MLGWFNRRNKLYCQCRTISTGLLKLVFFSCEVTQGPFVALLHRAHDSNAPADRLLTYAPVSCVPFCAILSQNSMKFIVVTYHEPDGNIEAFDKYVMNDIPIRLICLSDMVM